MSAIFTQDLLGNNNMESSQELDVDVHVPSGWEKRLDLKSGKVYLQHCSLTTSSSSSSSGNHHRRRFVPKLQDLNLPPSSSSSSSYPLNIFGHHDFVRQGDARFLDLQLTSSSSSASSWNYRGVCTLDKVKSALERDQFRQSHGVSVFRKSPSPCSSSSVSTEEEDKQVAAGCPNCLLYVLIPRRNPRCPRCSSVVPLPGSNKPKSKKKYQFDLNV